MGGQFVNTRSGYETRPTPNVQLTYHDTFGANRNWGVYVTGGINKEATNQYRTTQNLVNNATFGYLSNNNPAVRTNSLSFEGRHRGDRWEAGFNAFLSSAITDVKLEGSVDYAMATATLLTAFRPAYVVDATRDAVFPTVRITSANEDAVFHADNYQLGTVQQHRNYGDDAGNRVFAGQARAGSRRFNLGVQGKF